MASGTEFVGNYRLFHLIRAGATFEIWAVRPKSEDKPFAMKWLPKGKKYDRSTVAELKHEYDVGKGLTHPGVIETFEFGNTKEGAFVLMEFFKTPNLKQHIVNNLDVIKQGGADQLGCRVRDILVNAAAGISHMHEKGWVHRDIKPDNLLVNAANEVRVIDFTIAAKPSGGLSKLLGAKTKVQGTYSYMSPEQIRGQGVDPRDDVYSFGCMVHELLSGGKLPFTANSPNELLQRHLKSRPPLLTVFDQNIRPEFAAYVHKLLAKSRADRPGSMKEVKLALKTERIFHQPPKPPAPAAPPAGG
ncbi:MAG: serine/threonine-protein kinase [Planctomycetota bacterium]